MPVAFGSRCVEKPIFFRGEGVGRVAKAIQGLEVEAHRKRGRGKLT